MSPTPRTWSKEKRPTDCFDWITPEDVCRHALAAFCLARESAKPPEGRRFVGPDGDLWSGRLDFVDTVTVLFEMRIKTEAYQLGLNPDWANEAKMLQRWSSSPKSSAGHALSPQQSGSLASTVDGQSPVSTSGTKKEHIDTA